MKGLTLSRAGEGAMLFLLALSILWKGGKTLEMTWLLAIVASVVTILTLSRRALRVRKQEDESGDPHLPVWGTALFFACWTVLSYLLSETKNYGLDEVLREVSLVLLFLWTVRLLANKKDSAFVRHFLSVVTVASAIACILGLAVYMLEPVDRFVGSFFDYRFDTDFWPNAWGEYLLLAWPAVTLQAIVQHSIKSRRLTYALLGLMFGCLFLSYSRGSILALILQLCAAAGILALVALRDMRYAKKASTFLRSATVRALAIAGIAIVTFFAANALRSVSFEVQSVAEKATFTASEGRSSINERAQFWDQAWNASFRRPLFGYGPYSFRFVQTKDAQGVLATSDHPHNVFLKLAMERGWPAAVAFCLLILAVGAYSLYKMFFLRRTDWPWEHDARDLLFGIAVLGVLAHNMIDYNLQFVAIALPFWLLLAMLYAPAVAGRTNRTSLFWEWKLSRVCIKIEFLLAVALLVVTCVEGYYLGTSSFARHAEAAGDADGALQWYARSDGELFSRDMLLSEAVILMDKDRTPEAGDALRRYQELNPHDARVWKLKGILALKQGDPSLAFQNIRKAYELGKMTDLGITTLYLQSARAAGKKSEIEKERTDIDTLFSHYANAIGQNTHFIALSRNVEELQTVARLLGQFFPKDAQRYAAIAREASNHAAEERSRLSARTPGILW